MAKQRADVERARRRIRGLGCVYARCVHAHDKPAYTIESQESEYACYGKKCVCVFGYVCTKIIGQMYIS